VPLLAIGLLALSACTGSPQTVATPVPTSGSEESLSAAPASAGPSGAPASPTMSASSATTGTDARAALDAFRAFVETDQSFHLTGDMKMTIAGVVVDMDVVDDVSGGNERGTIDVRGPRVSVHLAVTIADGTAYLKIANRPWQKIGKATNSSNPLAGLRIDGLKAVDMVNVGGVLTHHFRVDDPAALNKDAITGYALTQLKISSTAFDLYIDDDGVPLTAILEFSGSGTFQGKASPIEATIRYDFSRFGVPVEIKPPA
jgi:hypothetical protein